MCSNSTRCAWTRCSPPDAGGGAATPPSPSQAGRAAPLKFLVTKVVDETENDRLGHVANFEQAAQASAHLGGHLGKQHRFQAADQAIQRLLVVFLGRLSKQKSGSFLRFDGLLGACRIRRGGVIAPRCRRIAIRHVGYSSGMEVKGLFGSHSRFQYLPITPGGVSPRGPTMSSVRNSVSQETGPADSSRVCFAIELAGGFRFALSLIQTMTCG